MDPISISVSISAAGRLVLAILDSAVIGLRRLRGTIRIYGPEGLVLLIFGNRATWQTQARVLGLTDDHQAMDFRQSVQGECTMIATAAAITAQIAITALSLSSLSKTHWIVRGFSVFSLTAALMAVYYATVQHKTVGRLLTAKQVRKWIRGGPEHAEAAFYASLPSQYLAPLMYKSWPANPIVRPFVWPKLPIRYCCDPQDLNLIHIEHSSPEKTTLSIIRQCFIPGMVSVITMSAPQVLLTSALMALLLALGIYLGFVWTSNLDTDAGLNDSRNVFIIYIVGLGLCFLVYRVSQIVQSADTRSDDEIVIDYFTKYLQTHPDWLQSLNLKFVPDSQNRSLPLVSLDNGQDGTGGGA